MRFSKKLARTTELGARGNSSQSCHANCAGPVRGFDQLARTTELGAVRGFVCCVALALWLAGCQSKPAPEAKTAPAGTSAQPYMVAQPAVTDGAPPDTIVIKSPYGEVAFTHKKHYERLNNDCTACHPKVFPQSLADLNYRKASHRAAEASMTSCASCHSIGNSAFAADSNCVKCHAPRDYPHQ